MIDTEFFSFKMITKFSDQDLLVVHDHPLHVDHAPGPSPVTEEGPDPGKFLFLSMKLTLELSKLYHFLRP